jgi:hypothetical protein
MKKLIQLFFAVAVLVGMSTQAFGQCAPNTAQYPSGSTAINTNGQATTITSCSWGGEYSVITGAVSGQTLKFTSSVGTDVITVRSGSFNGPVVAFGTTPVSFANTFNGTLYVHWNTAGCGSQNVCRTTTVQCVSCVPVPGQCTFTAPFGSATINPCGTSQVISSCSYAGEYSTVFGAVAGQQLRFTSSAGDYVTVHAGSPTGPVIASGAMPFTFNNTFTGTIYPHWSTNSTCGTQSTCRTTSVQCLSCSVPAPANDLCSGAITIGCNSSVSGSTQCNTGIDSGLPFCGTTGGTAPGVWYKFTGDGSYVSLSTCNAATNYDTKLHVFDGSCGAFTCVAGNDDYFSTDFTCSFSGLRSLVSFCAEAGHSYYVLVHGFSTAVGTFQLDMSCSAPLTVEVGECQSRFVGYTGPGAPDPLNYICPTISGGTAPYTTTISAGTVHTCDNGCYAVAPSATTTYTVTVTDANGCSASDEVTVNVIDVVAACPSNGQPKVQICHVPPGNPGNENNICVSPNAVPAHLIGGPGHGTCYLGPCGNTCTATNAACQPASCSGGSYTITISGTGYLDETVGSFAGTSFGPFGFGTTNTITVSVPSGTPSTFSLSTTGTFNDNIANYSISCGGNVVLSGTLAGGSTTTETGICCDGQIAPKAAMAPAQGGGIVVFPNPFTDMTTFKFRSATNGHASILVYNLAGKQVATAFDGEVAVQGTYEVNFNAAGLSAGVYLYRYTNAEGKMSMGKVNLVK